MSFETIIRYCAPTLAGMKVGSLFTVKNFSKDKLLQDIQKRNNLLNSKGIYFEIVKICDTFALVYVYRKNKLEQTIKSLEIQDFLNQHGYSAYNVDDVIKNLKSNLQNEDFPHEIGVFLGYPLYDIKSFIELKGADAKYVGYWKAYSNEEYARKTSEKFKRCTNIYCKKFAEGTDITRLTVAC